MGLLRNEVILSMDNEEKIVGNDGEQPSTDETTASETPIAGTTSETPQGEEIQSTMFTQEQVNDIVRDRLKKADAKFLGKYGLDNVEALDAIVEKGKGYDEIKAQMDLISNENKGLKEQITLTKNNIIPSKQDDVLTYFRGKGMELNDENLAKMLESHPEWLPNKTPTTTIVEMGAEGTKANPSISEEDEALKMFGLDKFVK